MLTSPREKLLKLDVKRREYDIIVIGEEAHLAYNRVGLTSFFQHRKVENLYLNPQEWYHAMPEGSRGFLDVIPALRNRECIVCGEGVSIPIRVSFDDLERDRRPASSDPLFSDLWRQTGDEEAMVGRVVKRWRAQGR